MYILGVEVLMLILLVDGLIFKLFEEENVLLERLMIVGVGLLLLV